MTPKNFLTSRIFYICAAALWLALAACSQAGLTLQLDLIDNGQLGAFTCSPNLSTNGVGTDATPVTYHQVRSPNSQFIGDLPGNNSDLRNQFPDFNAFLQELTNGMWTLIMNVGATNEHTYHFTVTTSNLTTNSFSVTGIDYPTEGAQQVSSTPVLQWHGPTNWDSSYVSVYNPSSFSVYRFVGESPTTTNDTLQFVFPPDTYTFGINYTVAASQLIASSTPKDASNNAAPGWVSTGQLEHGEGIDFRVLPAAVTNLGALTLMAHYPFDDSTGFMSDTSGNHNDITTTASFHGSGLTSSSTKIAGDTSAMFNGDDWFILPTNLLQTIAGSYSISLWINTSQIIGSDNDSADQGAGIVWAINNGNDSIPMALTGSKLGFYTDNPSSTVNSVASINTGPETFTHIVVTRDTASNVKNIYINGVLDAAGLSGTAFLNGSSQLLIGMDPNNGEGVVGLIDDVQIYSGVLNPSDVLAIYQNPGTPAPNRAASGPVAHYAFEDPNHIGADTSGNGYNLDYNGFNGVTATNDAEVGANAAYFDGNSYLSYNTAPPGILSAFAGDFTLSLWLKTTQTDGFNTDPAWADAGIATADVPGGAYDLVPMALTGGTIGFNTGNGLGNYDETINATTNINNNAYHHIVVTRERVTGKKRIFIDGIFNVENTDFASTNFLSDPVSFAFGAGIDASNPDPSSFVNRDLFQGNLDDIQLYSRVLSTEEITALFQSPGKIVGTADFNFALNTTNLNWTTSGDSLWVVETNSTFDNVAAAQSGPVISNQTSRLSVTVTGPGVLNFAWSTTPNTGSFDFEFDIDGQYKDDISGNDWQQDGPFNIPAGTHTLSWTAYANGDTDPTEFGYLDEVSFVVQQPYFITTNPFDQTNHPGYPVGLVAAVSNPTNAAWQWFKVNAGAIATATNAFYTPTNSGTPSVAGQYYAVVTSGSHTATTTTATVSFATAQLPPDWSAAFKSPFMSQNSSNVTQDFYYGAILDVSNNIYTAAEFDGDMTFGSVNLSSGSGGDAAAIVKQTATGDPLWVAAITNKGSGIAYGQCIAPAPGGGVYFSGNYNGTNYFNNVPLIDSGKGDIFLTRFDANGSNVWVRTLGTTNGDFTTINTLASDPSGNVTIAALLGAGSINLGSSNYNVTGQNMFLVQYDPSGTVRWSQMLPGELSQFLVYDSGRLYLSFSVSGDNTNSDGSHNIIVGNTSNITDRAWAIACLNSSNGQLIWAKGLGAHFGSDQGNPYSTSSIDDPPHIGVNGSNVFVTGVAYDFSASFGALTVNYAQQRGLYVARYDTNGNAQVATTYGSTTTTPLAAVADTQGNFYVSGDFDNTATFGVNLLAAPQERRRYPGNFSQAFLAKFDSNGNALWARQAVSPATVNFRGIALAPDGVWASGFCISTNVGNSYTRTYFGSIGVIGDSQLFVYEGGAGGSINIVAYGFPGGVLAKVTETNNVSQVTPVTLIDNGASGGNYHFSFVSTASHTNFVESSTNLASHVWSPYTNFVGDGSLKSFVVPANFPAQRFFRVRTQ